MCIECVCVCVCFRGVKEEKIAIQVYTNLKLSTEVCAIGLEGVV